MNTARQSAAHIFNIFKKHWAAFRQELSKSKDLKECRDKALAWSMAVCEISQFVYKQKGQDKNED